MTWDYSHRLNLHLALNYVLLFSVDGKGFTSLRLRLLLLFLYLFSCLLINARRYSHFGFHMTTSYLASVPLFKDSVWYTIVHLFVNNASLPVPGWLFSIFDYFALGPLVSQLILQHYLRPLGRLVLSLIIEFLWMKQWL